MSTETLDIFYHVKKEILDKLDLILQKVNLEIINSRHAHLSKLNQSNMMHANKNSNNYYANSILTKSKSSLAQSSGAGSAHGLGSSAALTSSFIGLDEDFTFIQLSQFQTQIWLLFTYLDKLYQSLSAEVSGFSTQGHKSNRSLSNIQILTQNQSQYQDMTSNVGGNPNQRLQVYSSSNYASNKNLTSSTRQLKQANDNLQLQFRNLKSHVEQLDRIQNETVSKLHNKQKILAEVQNILRQKTSQLNNKQQQLQEKQVEVQKLKQAQHILIQRIQHNNKMNKKIRLKMLEIQEKFRMYNFNYTQTKGEGNQTMVLKKWIASRLKQFKFQMLEIKVELLSKFKQYEQHRLQANSYENNQYQNQKVESSAGNRSRNYNHTGINAQRSQRGSGQDKNGWKKEKGVGQAEVSCHNFSQNQMHIINQINQILKIC